MREHFGGYIPLTDEEMAQMWQNAVFTFDANVLLHFYRYTPTTRDRFFTILDGLAERLWLSNQATLEFFKNRLAVIAEQRAECAAIEKQFTTLLNSIKSHRKPTTIDLDRLTSIVEDALHESQTVLEEARATQLDVHAPDPILSRLTNLLGDKVGPPYTDDELVKVHKNAAARGAANIPPGYRDAAKDGDRKYGDMVLWEQLIDFAKSSKKPIIFVTDDRKDDWWSEINGQKLGPRPELRQEMAMRAGVTFYLYQPDQFIERAQYYLNLQDEPAAVEEVRSVSAFTRNSTEIFSNGVWGGWTTPTLVVTGLRDGLYLVIPSVDYGNELVFVENISIVIDFESGRTERVYFSRAEIPLFPNEAAFIRILAGDVLAKNAIYLPSYRYTLHLSIRESGTGNTRMMVLPLIVIMDGRPPWAGQTYLDPWLDENNIEWRLWGHSDG